MDQNFSIFSSKYHIQNDVRLYFVFSFQIFEYIVTSIIPSLVSILHDVYFAVIEQEKRQLFLSVEGRHDI